MEIKIRIYHTSFTIRKISNTCLFYFKCRVVHRYTMNNLLNTSRIQQKLSYISFITYFDMIDIMLYFIVTFNCDLMFVAIEINRFFWSSFRSLFKTPEIEEEINKTGISNNFKHTLMIKVCPPEFRQLFKLKTRMKL